ncbi:hypothetical protein [Synechococcus sp. MU1611]|uniref:hypothetical protein n=1 Tax=Synechococcus sp. MU1611 TaxID=2508345 RepID=UPI001CF907C4|nr:hypothetical protein [Synechococcus sp. MU1611]MCB4411678.1 hypothetical protein [Synechococcus sp. MU1611]
MRKLLPLLLLPALVSCGGEEKHADRQAKLLKYRGADEVCTTASKACVTWTKMAIGCEENMQRRDEGYMGKFDRNWCSEMETYREAVTGVELSSDTGAYSF